MKKKSKVGKKKRKVILEKKEKKKGKLGKKCKKKKKKKYCEWCRGIVSDLGVGE